MVLTKTSLKRRFARKLKRKSRGRKIRRNLKNKTSVSVGLGFPKSLTMVQKYREIIPFSGGAGGAMQSYLVSCNGIYDPNITGTGHQPLYFDQLTALYDHYTVIGSRIKYNIINTSNTPCSTVTFINDDATVTPSLVANVAEQSTASPMKWLQGAGVDSGLRLSNKWSAKKYFKGSVLANTELQGTATANPTEQSYFAIVFQASDLSTAFSLVMEVSVEYICVWKELKDVAAS